VVADIEQTVYLYSTDW